MASLVSKGRRVVASRSQASRQTAPGYQPDPLDGPDFDSCLWADCGIEELDWDAFDEDGNPTRPDAEIYAGRALIVFTAELRTEERSNG
jgi:hypothetical protein